jgi:hypothetical protein
VAGSCGRRVLDLPHRTTVLRDDVLVIEEDEGQFSLAGCFLVGFKEAVETAAASFAMLAMEPERSRTRAISVKSGLGCVFMG